MTTTTPTPAGWYVDPTGRHERRYWDGAAWTASVSDAGITTTDEPQATIGAPAAYGYRAVAVATWRIAALYVVAFACLAAFSFEAVASANLRATASDLNRWAWLYREAPGVVLYGYPPLGLWLGLILTTVLMSALLLPPRQALKKAGLSAKWRWSALSSSSSHGPGQGPRTSSSSETGLSWHRHTANPTDCSTSWPSFPCSEPTTQFSGRAVVRGRHGGPVAQQHQP